MASLASMLIWTSALNASSDVAARAVWAISRLALAACKHKQSAILAKRQIPLVHKQNSGRTKECEALFHSRGSFQVWKSSDYYWGTRRAQNIPSASRLWKLHLSQKWLERRNAKHSWKLKVSQWGFDTSAITQQWLTFSCLLTVRVCVSFHCRLENNVKKKERKKTLIYNYKSNLTVTQRSPRSKTDALRSERVIMQPGSNETDIWTGGGRTGLTETLIGGIISGWEVLISTEQQTRRSKFKEPSLMSELVSPVAHRAAKTASKRTQQPLFWTQSLIKDAWNAWLQNPYSPWMMMSLHFRWDADLLLQLPSYLKCYLMASGL